ncbi:MAG: hypothetical protein ACQEP1_01155 [Nanobdellota archaeon]
MGRPDIRDILGLEEGEPLVREDINPKELSERIAVVSEYQKKARERKNVDWYKLSKIKFGPLNGNKPGSYVPKPTYSDKMKRFANDIVKPFKDLGKYIQNKYGN